MTRPGAPGSPESPLPVLVNAYAGLSLLAAERKLARTLDACGVAAVIEAVEPDRLATRIRELDRAGMVAVAGGDGTQRTAARALAGSDTALVPLPTGTLNHFARRIGLTSLEAAAEAVRAGRVRTIAIGRANDQVFLNTAVAGAYPLAVRVRDRLRRWLTKWPAATVAAGLVFLRWPSIEVTIRTAEMERRGRTAMVWAGLGVGSFPAVHESPHPADAGVLEVLTLPDTGRRAALTLVRTAYRRRRGRPDPPPTLEPIRSPWLELRARHRIPIALDGEAIWMEPPVCLQVEPSALYVVDLAF